MRAWVLCLLLALAGCATTGNRDDSTAGGLSEEELVFAKALAHYGQGLLDEATLGIASTQSIEELARAAELDPTRHRIRSRLAVKALMKGETERAIAELQRSAEHNPDLLPAWLDLARACQIGGRLDEAIRYYRRASRLAPENDRIRAAIATLFFEQDEDRAALRLMERGLRDASADSPLIAVCHNQGRAFIVSNQPARAIPCFELLRRHLPARTHQYDYLLGELYRRNGEEDAAVEAYRRATHHPSPLPEAFITLALLTLEATPRQAIQELERGAERLQNAPALLLTLAALYSQMQRYEDAIPCYRRVYAAAADSPALDLKADFFFNFGAALERAGRRAEAAEIFLEGLARHPATPQMLNYLAYMWAEEGIQLDQAETYARTALELEPESGAYLDTLGWIHYKQGRYESARDNIRRAQELMGEEATLHDHLGDVYLALGEEARAVAQWTKALRLDPSNADLAGKLRVHNVNAHPLREEADAPVR